MANETEEHLSEQDLSEGELVDQEQLGAVQEPPVRLAGYNQVPDFGNGSADAPTEDNE